MRQSYLFVYNDDVGTREQVKNTLDKMLYVVTWRYDMPNVFYIVSDYSAADLASQFESLNGTKGRFIFQEHTINSQGRLTGDSWYLLNNKNHKPV
jgi:hypothetical protein